MEHLISCDQVCQQIESTDCLIFDCRFSLGNASAGQEAYQQGHLPKATYVNMESQLSRPHIPGKTGRHPLPDKSTWLAQVQGWGIDPDKTLILYDDSGATGAARMWWMLRWLGHENVKVMNGGWQAWLKAGYAISHDLPTPVKMANFDYSTLPSLTKLLIAEQIDNNLQLLIDARALPRFRGDVEPLDPVAGHIPGAINADFSHNLDERGYFKPIQALQERFAEIAKSDKQLVCYCGSGVTAANNILAMCQAGLPEPALYAGSWSDWITDPQRGIATGD